MTAQLRSLVVLLVLVGGARTASAEGTQSGAQLFEQKCGICHFAGKTGAQMLERRLGKERALLAERRDLATVYIHTVVRHGLAGMPPLTRVELPDAELEAIAAYLTRQQRSPNAKQANE